MKRSPVSRLKWQRKVVGNQEVYNHVLNPKHIKMNACRTERRTAVCHEHVEDIIYCHLIVLASGSMSRLNSNDPKIDENMK